MTAVSHFTKAGEGAAPAAVEEWRFESIRKRRVLGPWSVLAEELTHGGVLRLKVGQQSFLGVWREPQGFDERGVELVRMVVYQDGNACRVDVLIGSVNDAAQGDFARRHLRGIRIGGVMIAHGGL